MMLVSRGIRLGKCLTVSIPSCAAILGTFFKISNARSGYVDGVGKCESGARMPSRIILS